MMKPSPIMFWAAKAAIMAGLLAGCQNDSPSPALPGPGPGPQPEKLERITALVCTNERLPEALTSCLESKRERLKEFFESIERGATGARSEWLGLVFDFKNFSERFGLGNDEVICLKRTLCEEKEL